MIKKIYLDVCTYCRPFDNQEIVRTRLETDAYYLILNKCYEGYYEPIIPPVHIKEVSAIPDVQERIEMLSLLEHFKKDIDFDFRGIRDRAEHLYKLRLGVADASHLAFAEYSADIFISCDDKLIKKYKTLNGKMPIMNPIEFVVSENLK